jgi:hypothetical protein
VLTPQTNKCTSTITRVISRILKNFIESLQGEYKVQPTLLIQGTGEIKGG